MAFVRFTSSYCVKFIFHANLCHRLFFFIVTTTEDIVLFHGWNWRPFWIHFSDPIEKFIDENKALIRRMYGEFQTPAPTSTNGGAAASNRRSVRHSTSPDKGSANSDWHFRDSELFAEDLEADGSSIFGGGFLADGQNRTRRQTNNRNTNKEKDNKSDACESTVEVVTPYWAANSSGKIRAIVNTQHFEQAVHQEVCSKPRTGRCNGDCSCEQKYKWHRLLAYDPDNDCKGIFMDWFLFPSCCVCRCAPL